MKIEVAEASLLKYKAKDMVNTLKLAGEIIAGSQIVSIDKLEIREKQFLQVLKDLKQEIKWTEWLEIKMICSYYILIFTILQYEI